jgi:hypothetical protein
MINLYLINNKYAMKEIVKRWYLYLIIQIPRQKNIIILEMLILNSALPHSAGLLLSLLLLIPIVAQHIQYHFRFHCSHRSKEVPSISSSSITIDSSRSYQVLIDIHESLRFEMFLQHRVHRSKAFRAPQIELLFTMNIFRSLMELILRLGTAEMVLPVCVLCIEIFVLHNESGTVSVCKGVVARHHICQRLMRELKYFGVPVPVIAFGKDEPCALRSHGEVILLQHVRQVLELTFRHASYIETL